MNELINNYLTALNSIGRGFCSYTAGIFVQSSVLIVLLLIIDFLLRKRVRAVFRYGLWMLVFVKLVMPASFTLPTGIGYWLGDYLPSEVSIAKFVPQTEEAVPMVIDIPQGYIFLETPMTNETAATGIELEAICWQGLVFLGWLVGMLVLLALLVRRICFVRGLIAQSRPANGRLLEMLDECRCQIGIRRNIELRLSGNKLSPAVCGLFKPIILMPATLPKKLSREKLKAVLIHELAHIKRGDGWVNLLQTILQIVYFYNPLVWIANAMVRRVREQAVDEMVLVTLRPETKNYSNMLIDIAEMAFWRPNFSLRIIGVVESKKALERRINHMLSRPVPKSSKLGCLGLIAIVVIGAILLPMGSNSMAEAANTQINSRESSETKTIVPGVRVGGYTFDMSKDEVLRKLGEPKMIFYGEERYTLDNLPRTYFMIFDNVSFSIHDDSIVGIGVHSHFYKFTNGLGVGDSEQKIKQAFGNEFQLREGRGKDFLTYEDKGLQFEIHKKKRTVMEIDIRRTTGDHGDSDAPEQQEKSKHTIVPGLRVGDYTLDMSKDDVLKELGEPEAIQLGEDDVVRRGEERYNLNNLPSEYIMVFGDISFWMEDDSVEAISVHTTLYKLSNGLGVGVSEQKMKQAFGEDFKLEEALGRTFLCKHAKGLAFEIHKKNQTVAEIVVYKPEGSRDDRDAPEQQEYSKHTIVPGLRVGDYTLGMSKDDVLNEFGEPKAIQLGEDKDDFVRRGEEKYNLNNLPNQYILYFDKISFWFEDDSVGAIGVHSPSYKLRNGLGVGDTKQKVKQTFGEDYNIKELLGNDYLCYRAKGIAFQIHKRNQTISEIVIAHPEGERTEGKRDVPDQREQSKHIIVPGERVGDFTLEMSKDEVLRKLKEPYSIRFGGQRYTLNNLPDNLPRRYIMSFSDFSFAIDDDSVSGITVRSPLYKFTNGLGVGDSEQQIKRAFGDDFQLEEYGWKNLLNYEDKGIQFEIRNKDKTVIEIDVYQAKRNQQSDRRSSKDLSTLVRQAAAKGRISFKLTTPDEFKAIAGRPTREWTDDDLICMEYPGIEVKFFGKPEIIPHTLVFVSCEGRGIDIGQNRPIVLRNEGDLDNFGSFWGYSSVDLSRLDLSKKGKLLKAMTFDSRTVWPEPDFLPPDFDPKAVMEWGKYPGLRVKQLHDRGVTGKGVHVAIIDQPLLLGHIEYKDQLVSYKEIQTGNADPQMHGPPVASILVGKTCGVAPEAILHYWAEPSWKGDYKYRCIALEQIIQYNREKTKSEQIRVVSVSKGFSLSEPNLDRWKALLEKAKQSGIYVVHCSSMGFGAGCRFLEDSDNPASYRLCAFYKGGDVFHESGTFFTPIDHRTTASEKARDAYTFWTRGGLSWGAPYYAGVVALGIQVNPNLRPDQIDKLLYDSGWDFQRGRLINPVGFVEAAQKAD